MEVDYLQSKNIIVQHGGLIQLHRKSEKAQNIKLLSKKL